MKVRCGARNHSIQLELQLAHSRDEDLPAVREPPAPLRPRTPGPRLVRADCGRSRLLPFFFFFFLPPVANDDLPIFLRLSWLLGRALLGLCFARGDALRVCACASGLPFVAWTGVCPWTICMLVVPRFHLETTTNEAWVICVASGV